MRSSCVRTGTQSCSTYLLLRNVNEPVSLSVQIILRPIIHVGRYFVAYSMYGYCKGSGNTSCHLFSHAGGEILGDLVIVERWKAIHHPCPHVFFSYRIYSGTHNSNVRVRVATLCHSTVWGLPLCCVVGFELRICQASRSSLVRALVARLHRVVGECSSELLALPLSI